MSYEYFVQAQAKCDAKEATMVEGSSAPVEPQAQRTQRNELEVTRDELKRWG
jgi:hypothetical protein